MTRDEGVHVKGVEPVAELDFSHKNLGVASAIVIAKLIEGNTALTSLFLGNNDLGPEGAKALADALA